MPQMTTAEAIVASLIAHRLDTIYDNYLASHFLAANDPGVAVGQQAALNVIAFLAWGPHRAEILSL